MKVPIGLIVMLICFAICSPLYAQANESSEMYKYGQLFGAILLVCIILGLWIKVRKRRR